MIGTLLSLNYDSTYLSKERLLHLHQNLTDFFSFVIIGISGKRRVKGHQNSLQLWQLSGMLTATCLNQAYLIEFSNCCFEANRHGAFKLK